MLFQEPLFLLFTLMIIGLCLGQLRVAGISLGTSGVLFSSLFFGHVGHSANWALPDGIGTFGLVLFVYAVGLSAGPTFFRTFVDQGRRLILLSAIVVSSAAAVTWTVMRMFDLPAEFAAGLLAGSMTSTPALASAVQTVAQAGGEPTSVSIGYGLAYPIGVVVTVLFVQLLPRMIGADFDELAGGRSSRRADDFKIGRRLVEVCNPALFGRKLNDLAPLQNAHGQLTRVKSGNSLVPLRTDHVFEEGQVVLLVAEAGEIETLTMILGRASDEEVPMDVDHERTEVVVTNPQVLGRPLRDLHLRSRFGVTISRIERYGASFVPSGATVLANGDRLTVVGPSDGLHGFLQAAGHRVRKLYETDILSMTVGLAVGIALGSVPIPIPLVGTITLGLAGGPLLAGLMLSHFGRFLGVVGYMPLAASMLTQELGLMLFLASAGFAAGGGFLEYVGSFGASPFLAALLIATLPIAVAYAVSRWIFRIDLLQTLGGTCGAMTSTAALGTLTSKTDSEIPVASYAAAYPMALVLMTIAAQLIVGMATS